MFRNLIQLKTALSNVILICVILVSASNKKSALRIIGGRDAHINEFPYVMQLEDHVTIVNTKTTKYKIHPSCTGAVLNMKWSLTAAHCFGRSKKRRKKTPNITSERMIRYGFFKGFASEEDKFSKVLAYFKTGRPGRSNKVLYEDLALLETEPIMITEYAKISAVDYPSLYWHEIILVGFGYTNDTEGELKITYTLKKPLQVLDKAMLKRCYSPFEYPTVCIAPSCGDNSTPCKGDSGGPVLHPSGIVGVISRGPGRYNCQMQEDKIRSKNILKITPVSPYINWISLMTARV